MWAVDHYSLFIADFHATPLAKGVWPDDHQVVFDEAFSLR
jgi:hypothetical protein